MNISSEFDRKLACGELDPLIRDLAVKIKRQWDPKGKSGYEVEDLMQEAYLKIMELEAADRFETGGRRGASKTTFMYACARNRLIDIERSRLQTKKGANIEFIPDIHRQVEKRQSEQNLQEGDPLEQVLQKQALRSICETLAARCREDGTFPAGASPEAELIFRILVRTGCGETAKKIAEDNNLSPQKLRKIRRAIYRLLKEEYEEEIREIIGGGPPQRRAKEESAIQETGSGDAGFFNAKGEGQ